MILDVLSPGFADWCLRLARRYNAICFLLPLSGYQWQPVFLPWPYIRGDA